MVSLDLVLGVQLCYFLNSKWLYQLRQREGLSRELAGACLGVDVGLLEAGAWVYHAPALH